MRLIDADALMDRLTKKKPEVARMRYVEGFNDAILKFRSMVHSAPTIEAVPVVRCKDCKYCEQGVCYHPEQKYLIVGASHFCGYGKRKDGKGECE